MRDGVALRGSSRATAVVTAATSCTRRRPPRDRHRRLERVRQLDGAATDTGTEHEDRRVHADPARRARHADAERDRDSRVPRRARQVERDDLVGDNQYLNPPEPSREVGIKTDWLRAEDLYVIADDVNPTTHVVFVKVLVKPLVNLIWVAGIVFLFGSLRRAVARRTRAAAARDPPRARTRVTTAASSSVSCLRPVQCCSSRCRSCATRRRGRPPRCPDRRRRAALRARRGARPGARGAEGAGVRPPHRQDHR